MNINLIDKVADKKIGALNILISIPIRDYLEIAREIKDENEMQRTKVQSSKTVYSLLRSDLKAGCTIPPIVLAVRKETLSNTPIEKLTETEIINIIKQKKMIILDGLQRTFQLLDLERELLEKGQTNIFNEEDTLNLLEDFYNRRIRVEIFIGINKIGILYRMMTLNTGQTPMSIRHQIEILYQDYIGPNSYTNPNITLYKEVKGDGFSTLGRYKFSDIVDGFKSYLEKDELSLDKLDLLQEIKSLEKLSKLSAHSDLFSDFLNSYHSFLEKTISISNNWIYDEEYQAKISGPPFGKDCESIFVKPQILTAFGAAIGTLEDIGEVTKFDGIIDSINKIKLGTSEQEFYIYILEKLDEIRATSKKIGNSQRRYFYHFFKVLFMKSSDSYCDMYLSSQRAYKMYQVEFM